MTILEQLADYARERTEQGKRKRSLEELKKQALSLPDKKFEFENAIKRPGLSFLSVRSDCKRIRGGWCRMYLGAYGTEMVSWKQ